MADRIALLAPYAERFHKAETRPIAPRLPDLRGTTIGFIYNKFNSIGIINDELRRSLAPYGIKAIELHKKSYGSPLDPDQMRALLEGADAVISGLCNSPPSTSWGAHDNIALEKQGKPTVTLVTKYYEDLLAETVASEGMPELKRVVLPFPLEGLPEEIVRTITRKALDAIIAALILPGSETIARV